MPFYRVLHDFHGEESVELSVHKGQCVDALDNVIQDGWLKVQTIDDGDTPNSGFVPFSYLEVTAGPPVEQVLRHTSRSPSTPQRRAGTHASGAPGDTIGHKGGVGTTSPSVTTPTRQTVTDTLKHQQLTPARADTDGGPIDRSFLSNPNAVVEAFMKNEIYFKQLMRNRAASLAQLEEDLEESIAEVAACKDRNCSLTRKLRELDQVVEKERRRWTERLEEEKAHISRSLAYSAGTGLFSNGSRPNSNSTSPVRLGRPAATTAGSSPSHHQ